MLSHVPVLLDESIAALNLADDAIVVDGTFGGGGHTVVILERYPMVRVIAIDRDEAAIARAEAMRQMVGPDRLTPIHGSFADLTRLLAAEGGHPTTSLRAGSGPPPRSADSGLGEPPFAALESDVVVDAILLDLGLSSFQLDDAERGFAFRLDGPLDMRFDPSIGVSAADLVADLDERSLADLIYRNGDERRSRPIAAAIVRERAKGRIDSTVRLAAIVESAVGGRRGSPTHPATQTFLALRIAVNDEMGALAAGLDAVVNALRPGGRLAVISFHSIEDRQVKQTLRAMAAACICPPAQPICTCQTTPRIRVVGKPIRPTEAESKGNPRSRSATLRVAERLTLEGTRHESATDPAG